MLVFKEEKKFLDGYCVSAMKDAITVVVLGYPRNAKVLIKKITLCCSTAGFFPRLEILNSKPCLNIKRLQKKTEKNKISDSLG